MLKNTKNNFFFILFFCIFEKEFKILKINNKMGVLNMFNSLLPSFTSIRKEMNSAMAQANQILDDFSFEDVEKKVKETKEELVSEFKEISSSIKNLSKETDDKFLVEIPYDRDEQKLSFKVDEGNINVIVADLDNIDNVSEYTISIPSSVNEESLSQKYNKEKLQMEFSFEKKEEEEEVKEENDDTEKGTETNTSFKDLVSKAIALRTNGWSFRKIAKEIGVSDKTVARWVRKFSN